MPPGPPVDLLTDPALAVRDGTIAGVNDRAARLFGASADAAEGTPLAAFLGEDEVLAASHEATLCHYPDVAGVVADGRRHFDADHPTVAALRDGADPRETDPDLGVLRDGERRYVHVRQSETDAGRVLVFRDITAVKRREQDLEFLRQGQGRVLRHNLRNDLTVIRGCAADIAERADGERATLAERIRAKSEDLAETTEKARLIEDAVDRERRAALDLQAVVERAVRAVRRDYPAARMHTDVPAVSVRAHPLLEVALETTVENGVEHNHREQPTVRVRGRIADDRAVVRVVDDGPGIPDRELEALERRGETDLVHASGAGHWLTQTVVHVSGGDLAFGRADGETTVTLRLPLADAVES